MHGSNERPEELLRSYAAQVDDEVRVDDAKWILDYKISSPLPSLRRWSDDDVDALLFEYLPSHVEVEGHDEADDLLESVTSLFSFLDASGRLSKRSVSGNDLALHARSHRDEFREAMSDPIDPVLAEQLTQAMLEEGVDIDDETEVRAWLTRLQDEVENEEWLDDEPVQSSYEPAVELPPRPPIPEEEARNNAAASPLLEKVIGLAEYMGEGRTLTDRGNIRLADARQLVTALGTGDIMDHDYGDGTQQSFRSAQDLRWLDLVVWVAVDVGAVLVSGNRMAAVAQQVEWLQRYPLQAATDLAQAVIAPGPLNSLLGESYTRIPVRAVVDASWVAFLATAYEREWEFESALENLAASLETLPGIDPYYLRPEGRSSFQRQVSMYLELLLRVLGWAGLVEWTGFTEQAPRFHDRPRRGGTISITPFGEWLLQNPLQESGLVSAPITASLEVTLDDEPAAIVAALAPYVGRPSALADAWAQLGGYAGLPDQLWRVDHPATGEVLEQLGRALPDKAAAKGARRALLKHRSWSAGRT